MCQECEGRSANYEDMISGAHRTVENSIEYVCGRSYGPSSISNLVKMRVQFMTLGSYQTHGNLVFFSSVPLCLQLSHILLCALGHIPDSLLQDLGRQAKMSIELLGDR